MGTPVRASLLSKLALYRGFVAGAPAVDDDTLEISGDVLQIKTGGVGTDQLATDGIERGDLKENALDVHMLPLSGFMSDALAALGVSANPAGTFYRNPGTSQFLVDGEETINETEVSVGWFDFCLPNNYVAGGDLSVRVVGGLIDAGSNEIGTCTIDVAAYLQAAAGTVGSDLSTTTAAQAIQAAGVAIAPAALDFVITPTSLVAGDHILVKVTSSVVETAGNGGAALCSRITGIGYLADVK